MAKLDYQHLNSIQRYSQWAVFKAIPGALDGTRDTAVEELKTLLDELAQEGAVVVRGVYDVTGCAADGDIMIWWYAEEFEQLQDALGRFRRTALGRATEIAWIGNGLHRPAEFNKAHLPSFIMGEEPSDWATVYPFVRSYEWYVMDPAERRRILSEHGQAGRDYPDVRANTVSAFALGDYEWMLCFEAPELHRIVDLMHAMRYTDARLHVRKEIPFYTGRRIKAAEEIVKNLP